MEYKAAIRLHNIKKKFKKFSLEIENLTIPEGFATALIGENGAGKSTLMNILGGVRKDFEGEIEFWGETIEKEKLPEVIGFTSLNGYFLPRWTIENVGEVSEILFENFSKEKYQIKCEELGIWDSRKKKIEKLSEGMKMKTALAAVWARNTKMLVLDEPASPLDPLMRDRFCSMIREYLEEGEGKKSVLYSTHNIADMENVTDYCIIMNRGKVLEKGFVEELKEKYLMVKAEKEQEEILSPFLIGMTKSDYGLEGLCEESKFNCLAGTKVLVERPTLLQISISLMKQHSVLEGGR